MSEVSDIIEEGREHIMERMLRENRATLCVYKETPYAWIQVGDWRFYFHRANRDGGPVEPYEEQVETVARGVMTKVVIPYDGWEFCAAQEAEPE